MLLKIFLIDITWKKVEFLFHVKLAKEAKNIVRPKDNLTKHVDCTALLSLPIDHYYESPMSNDFAFYSQFKYILMALFQSTFRRLIALFSFPPSMSKDRFAAHPRFSLQKNIRDRFRFQFIHFISIIYSSLFILQDK